jgi:hypothetical protein
MPYSPLSRRAGLIALVAIASLAGAHDRWADAQTGAYRPPPLGTEFFTSDTARFRVVDILPDGVVTENSSKARATWLGGLTIRDLSADDRARLMRFFPLQPGARFGYDAYSGSNSWHHELAVLASDEMRIGKRTVLVFRITRHEKGRPPNRFEGEYTAWYAPEYGFPLMMSYRHISGDAPNFKDWQVVHIVPPGSADGVWSFDLSCSDSSFIRFPRAVVRDGVIVSRVAQPSSRSSAIRSS